MLLKNQDLEGVNAREKSQSVPGIHLLPGTDSSQFKSVRRGLNCSAAV